MALVPPRWWNDPRRDWTAVLSDPWYSVVLSLGHHVLCATNDFFHSAGFVFTPLPCTTTSVSSPAEPGSDSEPVLVSIRGVDIYLADSMQFGLEVMVRLHPRGVFYVMPCFRGEPTDAQHLPQFTHIEVEVAGGLEDVITLAEGLLRSIADAVLTKCHDLVLATASTDHHLRSFIDHPVERVRFQDAAGVVEGRDSNIERARLSGNDHVQLLHKYGRDNALWITHFPHNSVPFYQASEGNSPWALCADLHLGALAIETVGAGERHLEADAVRAAIDRHGLACEPYDWYVRLRELRPMRTAGFGIGLERLLLWILRHDDIRDVSLFYREQGRAVTP
ncbi:MAG: amino acid--tRNA ligase-related protein [Phycisphaerales bacterium]